MIYTESVRPCLTPILEGVTSARCCVLAYGATGSGKVNFSQLRVFLSGWYSQTYTMLGGHPESPASDEGIVSR